MGLLRAGLGLLVSMPLTMGGCTPWFVTESDILRSMDRDGDGWAAVEAGGQDCDDEAPGVNPDVAEVCEDLIDNDCNGLIDDFGDNNVPWYFDGDGDGYGLEGTSRPGCVNALFENWSRLPGDCSDTQPERNPGLPDNSCDGVDNDCDGLVDEDAVFYYPDLDQDGQGDGDVTPTCQFTKGWVTNPDDCDDSDARVHPGAPELCDQIDNDCDGAIDDVFAASLGEDTFTSLAAAIQQALSEGAAVETVGVCALGGAVHRPGTIGVGFGQTLILQGSPIDPAVIEPPAGATLFNVGEGGWLRIDGLVLQGGVDATAIRVHGRLDLTNSVVQDCDAGALWVEGRALVIDAELRDNQADRGAALFVAAGGDVVVQDSLFVRNTAAVAGGAAYVETLDGGRLEVRDSDFGAGADNNAPHDVATPIQSYDYDQANHSFVCDGVCQ